MIVATPMGEIIFSNVNNVQSMIPGDLKIKLHNDVILGDILHFSVCTDSTITPAQRNFVDTRLTF